MSFSDRFVLWVYFGLADVLPVGRDAAIRIFDLAQGRGRFVLTQLNDVSILVLLAVVRQPSAFRIGAQAEAIRRGLDRDPHRVWRLLQSIRTPRIGELMEIGRPRIIPLRRLRSAILTDPLIGSILDDLLRFLGRLNLVEPATQIRPAVDAIIQATNRYDSIPLGTYDYRVLVYAFALRGLRLDQTPLPTNVPAGAAWFTALDADEQQFVRSVVDWLPEPELLRFSLHVHARLPADRIAEVLSISGQLWTVDEVARDLELSWQMVLA